SHATGTFQRPRHKRGRRGRSMGKRRAGVAAIGFVSIVAAGLLAIGSVPAVAAPVIQPGSSLEFGNSFCTMNWVYDAPNGVVYVGAAGHCTTGVGQEVDLATGSLGTPIERIGQVSFVGTNLDYCF